MGFELHQAWSATEQIQTVHEALFLVWYIKWRSCLGDVIQVCVDVRVGFDPYVILNYAGFCLSIFAGSLTMLIALPHDITAGVHSVIKGSSVFQNMGSEVCFYYNRASAECISCQKDW